MKPRIAIPQMGHDLFRRYMKSKYAASLRRAGAIPCWIELTEEKQALEQLFSCDGLLLPGGADVDPALYGQEKTELCGAQNALRDTMEFTMLEAWLPTGKPVLCICRGVQMLNVFRGGTLHQDIKSIQGCSHSDFRRKNKGNHMVSVVPDTRLHSILRASAVKVNSLHHQAVDRVGEGLKVSAVSEDGVIEALELETHPYCVGVQWHPEHMAAGIECQQRLFDAFVDACK